LGTDPNPLGTDPNPLGTDPNPLGTDLSFYGAFRTRGRRIPSWPFSFTE
jgi:hypothetical protein